MPEEGKGRVRDEKAALVFEGRSGSGGEKAALKREVEKLQKLIGEKAVECTARGFTDGVGAEGSGSGVYPSFGSRGAVCLSTIGICR